MENIAWSQIGKLRVRRRALLPGKQWDPCQQQSREGNCDGGGRPDT